MPWQISGSYLEACNCELFAGAGDRRESGRALNVRRVPRRALVDRKGRTCGQHRPGRHESSAGKPIPRERSPARRGPSFSSWTPAATGTSVRRWPTSSPASTPAHSCSRFADAARTRRHLSTRLTMHNSRHPRFLSRAFPRTDQPSTRGRPLGGSDQRPCFDTALPAGGR